FERLRDDRTGRAILVPEIFPEKAKSTNPLKVHFIGGGGSAGALLTEAWQLGHKPSLGVSPIGDSDTDAATRIGIPLTTSPPQTTISNESVQEALLMAAQSDLVI